MNAAGCSIPLPGEGEWRDVAVVLGTNSGGGCSESDVKLLSAARSVADQFGCYVWALACGPMPGDASRTAIAAGADAVQLSPAGASGTADRTADALSDCVWSFVRTRRPEVLMAGPDPAVHAALARVAQRAGTAFVAAGSAITPDPSTRLVSVRVPRYGGQILVDLVSPSARPLFCTLDPAALPPAFTDRSREGEVVEG